MALPWTPRRETSILIAHALNNEKAGDCPARGRRLRSNAAKLSLSTLIALHACIPDVKAQTSSGALDEVIVSARKRDEKAQQVPISVSVRNGGALADANQFRLQDILRSMPNVSTEIQQPRQTSIVVRGLGKNPANDGLESSAGVFLDGVYLGRIGMAANELVDVERVELLRGPQGTLFGKNTTAGALNIVTRPPADDFESWAQVTVGNEDYAQLSGAISAPLVPRTLAFRLSAFDSRRAGLVNGDTLGRRLGELDRAGGRAQLLWTPTQDARVRLIADYSSQDEYGPGYQLIDPGIVMADGSLRPDNFLQRSARAGYTPVFDPFARRSDADAMQRIVTEQAGFSAEAEVRVGHHLLTSITAWRKWNFRPQNDGDFSALDILPQTGVASRHRQFSEEIRLASMSDGPLDYLLGAYLYLQELQSSSNSLYGADAADFMSAGLTPLALDGFRVTTKADPRTDSAAAFVQGRWRPGSAWELTAGARWTQENRSAHITRDSSGGAPLSPTNAAAIAVRERIGGFVSTEVKAQEDFVSGLLSARYTINDRAMTYLSVARGAKSGGINVAVVPAGVDPTLDPEIANTVEVGWKGRWLADRLQLNLAGFWMEVDGYQTSFRDRVRNTFYLSNAGSVRSRGVELESHYRPVPDLDLSLAAGWNDASFSAFRNAPCPVETVNPTTCDFTGERVPGSPPWSATGAIHYDLPVRNHGQRIFVDMEYTRTAAHQLDFSDYTREGAYGLASLQFGFGPRDDRWRVWAWGKNLLDAEFFVTKATSGIFASGAVIGLAADPRTYGLSARARF
jgi:iron complex outermembrane receptor protein